MDRILLLLLLYPLPGFAGSDNGPAHSGFPAIRPVSAYKVIKTFLPAF